jgi:hypothetical protein
MCVIIESDASTTPERVALGLRDELPLLQDEDLRLQSVVDDSRLYDARASLQGFKTQLAC